MLKPSLITWALCAALIAPLTAGADLQRRKKRRPGDEPTGVEGPEVVQLVDTYAGPEAVYSRRELQRRPNEPHGLLRVWS